MDPKCINIISLALHQRQNGYVFPTNRNAKGYLNKIHHKDFISQQTEQWSKQTTETFTSFKEFEKHANGRLFIKHNN